MSEKKYHELLNHLIVNYRISTLEEIFGISEGMWRQHKSFVDTAGKSGTKMSLRRREEIVQKYKEFIEISKNKVR